MSTRIVELFGYHPADRSLAATKARELGECPFIGDRCQKVLRDKTVSGVCTLQPAKDGPVICCPYRLYFNDYQILSDIAKHAFGVDAQLLPGQSAKNRVAEPGRVRVAVFGKRWGKELRLPTRGLSGAYFVDWILARLDDNGKLEEFVAVEVQSIDTTGNYRQERADYMAGTVPSAPSTAGFNWENVNKRILPQLIYKGHVLRRERLCKKGLYFVCPTPVYEKIRERLGGKLLQYQLQPGALSLMWYDLDSQGDQGVMRSALQEGVFTTTVDQIALAFTAPSNLPDENVYESAILAEL